MNHICYIIAMQAEAQPFIQEFQMEEVTGFFSPYPFRLYQGEVDGSRLSVVLLGQQHGTDLVGCEAASITAMAAIQGLAPDLIVNSGTCGAFKADGAAIAEVYVGNAVMFHDRRVPGDDEWGTQALGNYPLWSGSAKLAEALGLRMGKVTTGSSLDLQPVDEEIIRQHGGQLKDMEAASIAFVCSLTGVPLLLVKSVTDLCDGGEKTYDEFRRNLSAASHALRDANLSIVRYLSRSKLICRTSRS